MTVAHVKNPTMCRCALGLKSQSTNGPLSLVRCFLFFLNMIILDMVAISLVAFRFILLPYTFLFGITQLTLQSTVPRLLWDWSLFQRRGTGRWLEYRRKGGAESLPGLPPSLLQSMPVAVFSCGSSLHEQILSPSQLLPGQFHSGSNPHRAVLIPDFS